MDVNINYENVLEDLRRRREELDTAIAAIERILGQGSSSLGEAGGARPARGPAGQIRSDEFFGLTIPAAIKRYLEIMKRPQLVTEIANGIQEGGFITQAKNFYANVSTALRRLDDRGEVVQLPDTKQWGLATWYPSKPKRNGGKKTKADPAETETGAVPTTATAPPSDGVGEE